MPRLPKKKSQQPGGGEPDEPSRLREDLTLDIVRTIAWVAIIGMAIWLLYVVRTIIVPPPVGEQPEVVEASFWRQPAVLWTAIGVGVIAFIATYRYSGRKATDKQKKADDGEEVPEAAADPPFVLLQRDIILGFAWVIFLGAVTVVIYNLWSPGAKPEQQEEAALQAAPEAASPLPASEAAARRYAAQAIQRATRQYGWREIRTVLPQRRQGVHFTLERLIGSESAPVCVLPAELERNEAAHWAVTVSTDARVALQAWLADPYTGVALANWPVTDTIIAFDRSSMARWLGTARPLPDSLLYVGAPYPCTVRVVISVSPAPAGD